MSYSVTWGVTALFDKSQGTNYAANYSLKGLILSTIFGALLGGFGWGFSTVFQALSLTVGQYIGLSVFCFLLGLDLKVWAYFEGKSGDFLWSSILNSLGDVSWVASGAAAGGAASTTKRISRELVCKGAILEYCHDTILMPNGHEVIFDTIVHQGASAVLPVTDDGKLAHKLISPKSHVDKTYYVEVDGVITTDVVKGFEEGIDIPAKKAFGVQYYPNRTANPADSKAILDKFKAYMGKKGGQNA